jgi:predicted nucleotidyltransferase
MEEAVAKLKSDNSMQLTLVNQDLVEIFPDWFVREAKRISRILADKFGANAVYLFGSFVWSDTYFPETDIDLAASGIPFERLYKALGYLEEETQYPFDLVDLDDIPVTFRERILAEGKLLYEREPVAVS